jgi:hypothetical protein
MAVETPVVEAAMNGANIAVYEKAANGQTAVEIITKFRKVLAYTVCWASEPSNPTYGVYVYSKDTTTYNTVALNVKCTHAAETTTFVLTVYGQP